MIKYNYSMNNHPSMPFQQSLNDYFGIDPESDLSMIHSTIIIPTHQKPSLKCWF